MENVKKHRDIKLVTTEKTRRHVMWKPNYHTGRWFPDKSTGNQSE